VADKGDITGTDWSDNEQDLIVADYFDMLALEFAGEQVNKAERNRALQALTGRGRGSIEYKHMNLSAALVRLGLPIINGYKPYPNMQDSLLDAIDRYLTGHPGVLEVGVGATDRVPLGFEERSVLLFEEPPPALGGDNFAEDRQRMQALIRKFDPVERDERNRTLGRAGEALVVEFEQRRLHDAGRRDLADQVRWVADLEGDGHGYDIASFAPNGQPRLIEVKTTGGGQRTPFFLSRNEERVSREREEFRLYRLYDFTKNPKLFKLRPPISESVVLETEIWRAKFG
jgi:hypothetical protein